MPENDFFSVTRVIEINGTRFTAGLTWEPLTGTSTVREEINAFSREESMNLVTVHQTMISVQAGFAKVDSSHIRQFTGSYSLASVLAERLGDSWLGVFDLKDGNYVLIAVRDGMILPGCDVIGGIKDVYEVLADIISIHDWGRVLITDNSLLQRVGAVNIDNLDSATLEDLLEEKRYKREHKLRQIKNGIDRRLLIGGVVVLGTLALSGLGYFIYQTYIESYLADVQAQQDAQAGLLRAERLKTEKEKAIAKLQEMTIQPTWVSQPAAKDVVAACQQGFMAFPINIVGWELDRMSCNRSQVSASYARLTGSTMMQMQRWAEAQKANGVIASFTVNPDLVRINVRMPNLPARGAEPLFKEGEWIRMWLSHFQALGLPSSLTAKPHPEPPAPEKRMVDLLGKEQATPPKPWWVQQDWTFSSDGISVPAIMARWPGEGFVIHSIDVTVKDLPQWHWEAKGEINVKP